MGVKEVKFKTQLENIERLIKILDAKINVLEDRVQNLEAEMINIKRKLLYG
jgi:hypothetical protein